MDEKNLETPHGDVEWSTFLCSALKELLEKDARVVQDERFGEALKGVFFDWVCLCQLYYIETDFLILHIHMLVDGDFALDEYLRWTKERDERVMECFLTLKTQIMKLQADGTDHSYAAWLRSRPFHSDAIIQSGDHLNSDDFTVRTYGVLMRSGIESMRQLSALSEDQIQSIGRLGARGIQEVLDYRKRLLQVDDAAQTEERDMCD